MNKKYNKYHVIGCAHVSRRPCLEQRRLTWESMLSFCGTSKGRLMPHGLPRFAILLQPQPRLLSFLPSCPSYFLLDVLVCTWEAMLWFCGTSKQGKAYATWSATICNSAQASAFLPFLLQPFLLHAHCTSKGRPMPNGLPRFAILLKPFCLFAFPPACRQPRAYTWPAMLPHKVADSPECLAPFCTRCT